MTEVPDNAAHRPGEPESEDSQGQVEMDGLPAIFAMLAALERATSSATDDLDPDVAARLARCLGHRLKSVRRRAADILATAMQSGALPPALCEAQLGSEDPATRWSAAFALGRAGRTTPRVIDVSLEQFDLPDGDVRWAAAAIIVPVARVIEDLRTRLRALAGSGDATMRKMALLCLAEAGDRDIALYVRGLGDADTFVRLAGVKALGRMADRSPAVISALRALAAGDPEARIRRAAGAIADRLEAASDTE